MNKTFKHLLFLISFFVFILYFYMIFKNILKGFYNVPTDKTKITQHCLRLNAFSTISYQQIIENI